MAPLTVFAHAVLLSLLLSQQRITPSSLAVHESARRNDHARLMQVAREHNDTLRAAFSLALQRTSRQQSAAGRSLELGAARRLAHAYAVVWHDPFFVYEVTRFAQRTPARQRARINADSLRKAGVAAFTQIGVPAAMRLWRASLQHAVSAQDSVAQAAVLGYLGAGFYRLGQLADAQTYLTRSQRMAAAAGDLRTTATAIGILASVYKDRGELVKAAEMYTSASALRQRSGDSRGVAADQNNLGLIARDLGDLSAANSAFQRALSANQAARRWGPASINLLNLAGIGSLLGNYAQADRWYSQALSFQRTTRDEAEIAFTFHERGLLRIRRGDYSAAHADLSAAVAAHDAAGATVEAATVRRDIAAVLMAIGEPQRALTMLRQAETAARAANASDGEIADFVLARGDLAVELNGFEEAGAYYLAAEQLYRRAADDFGLGKVADGRGLLLHLRGNYAGAVAALTGATRAYQRAGDERAAALTGLAMAYAQMQLSDTSGAQRTIAQARNTLRRTADVIGEAAALQALGDLALVRHTPVLADAFFREGIQKLGARPATNLRWRLYAGRAAALRQQHALPAAVQQLHVAVTDIERSASKLSSPERRASFLADKLHVYGDLVLAERARGNVGAAFAVSERMRAQHMLALLARARVSTAKPKLAQEQDLRRQIGDLMSSLDESSGEGSGKRESVHGTRNAATLREALYDAQTRYARLLIELREHEPAYAAAIRPANPDIATITAHLRTDEAMIGYVMTDSTTLAFVFTDRGASLVDLNIARRVLAPRIDFAVRVTQRTGVSAAGSLWQAPLSRLYDDLIAPLESTGLLKGKQSLIIVPHGELHFVPFAALVNRRDRRFVISRWELSYAPSASVWLRLRQATPQRRRGVLALAPRADALPFSTAEVNGIKRIYGRAATVFTGTAATKHAVRTALPRVGVVHFATLGVLNKHNPLFSFLDLGGRAGQRERLEVHEAFNLDLRGQLIVLSACQTGVGSGALADVPPGDDWIGLVQAFLSAGAGAVVASLWSVNDRATAELMMKFHEGLRSGRGDARSLAEAQRAAIRNPKTAHPFYWAAFTLNSGGGD